ncbi:MAG: hypothetical protein ACLR2E_08215 [Lachnospiraceae bacterium]
MTIRKHHHRSDYPLHFLALVGNAAGLFNFKGNKTKLNQTTTEVSTETETGSETESDNLQQVTEEANTPVTVPSLTGKTEKRLWRH